ncbi:MAG: TIGR03546 family protein [Thiohalorhabdus sp.]|uniref:TIGR03546 family protein n=1 Tax=Thiohalorhabdus sp. TaxID=3094134 RepID=UPI00397F9A5B
MLQLLARLLKALNSENSPAQLAGALALGVVVGMTPLWSPHNLLVFLLALVLRINLTTFLLAWGLFTGLAFLLDPWFHALGLALLTSEALRSLWTALYNTAPGRLSGLFNTVTLGSLLASLAAAGVLFPATLWAVRRYRRHVLERVRRSRIMTFLRANRLYRLYAELRG